MTFKSFLRKALMFVPILGGFYASRNPSSRVAISIVTAIIDAGWGQEKNRTIILNELEQEFVRQGFSEELRALARAFAEKYLSEHGF